MPRFLHIADIHLGFDRYNNSERTKDFYYALSDVIDRYAIAEAVDFVLIAGDLFEHRVIQPGILNQAQLCLQKLQAAKIPVLAIEGNHDNTPYGTSTSWLKYLSQWGLLQLLEPGDAAADDSLYSPWDGHKGGYIDLPCGVRVLGSSWYGAAAPKAIEKIAAAMATLPSGPEHTVLMFHHGLEGQIARYRGALRYEDLRPLQDAGVDYLALGHIHKNYSVENWVFNPGSLEANNVEESRYDRGAYLVNITSSGIQASLKREYQQRAIVRLKMTTRGEESETELSELARSKVEDAIVKGELIPNDKPLVELRIEGSVGFERLSLDLRQLQTELKTLSGALLLLLKYDVDEIAFQSPNADEASREQIERTAFLDVLAGHRDYKKRAEHLATALVDLKHRQLMGQGDEVLYEYVEEAFLE